jgi:GR25 family glycosyltransferase involved in LPS biosynthesis
MSHVSVIKKALEDGVDYAIIFEDDVIICDDFIDRLKYLERCKVEFDLFYLGGNFGFWHKFTPTENKYIYRYTGSAGTWAYIVSNSIFEFIEKNYRFDMNIDGFYSKFLAGENDPLERTKNYPKFDVKGFLPLAATARNRLSSLSKNMHTVDDSKFQKSALQFDM